MTPNDTVGLKVIFGFFFGLASIFVSLRIYIRIWKTKPFGSDDCFLLASLTSFALFTTAGLLSVVNGIGARLPSNVDPNFLSGGLRFWFISEVLYICTITLLRLSFALQLRTVAKTIGQQWTLLALVALIIVYNIGFFMLVLFQYCPVQYFWTGWLSENGNTLDQNFVELVTYGFAGVGAASDWALVLLSPWFYWNLEFHGRIKFCFRLLMFLGLCAGAACLVRIPTTKALLSSHDFFLDCIPIAIGSIIECGLGMAALSATTFRALCPHFFAPEPKDVPVSPAPVKVEEKTSIDSNSIRKSYLTTGVEISNKNTTQRKPSQERTST